MNVGWLAGAARGYMAGSAEAIGLAAGLIEEGDTVQIGVHTEVLPPGLVDLARQEVVTWSSGRVRGR